MQSLTIYNRRLTERHSQSGSPIPPGVWKLEKSACPEVLGCRLNSFPASQVNEKQTYQKGNFIRVANKMIDSGTNLPFCFKRVGVQAVNIIKDHVVIKGYEGTADAKVKIIKKGLCCLDRSSF